MRITFNGAAGGEVTGSCHVLEACGKRILLDCGMVQGSREAEARNQEAFAFDPTTIDALVLSHAHIDHIGRVPLLVKRGFKGPIFAQAATCDLLPIMLLDAASLAEHAADFANRDRATNEPEVLPLYTRDVRCADVIASPLSTFAVPVRLPLNWFTTHVVTPPAASGRSEPKKNWQVPTSAHALLLHCVSSVQAVPSLVPPMQ